jgi:predicted RNase H-like nuclease (RuvC/YqgF family)
LDIFKKNQEEHPPEEQVIPVQPETPEASTKEPEQHEADQPLKEPQNIAEESLSTTLETLKREESTLLDQKTQLLSIEERLRLKTLEEIEKTKQRISGLKTEIPELKQKCESFAKALEIPVYNVNAD